MRHLRNSSGVVRDRAICVDREGNAERGEHSDTGEGNPVEAGLLCCDEDGDSDDENRPDSTLEPYGKTCDNIGRRTGLGCLHDPLGGLPVIGCVVLGDEPYYETSNQP